MLSSNDDVCLFQYHCLAEANQKIISLTFTGHGIYHAIAKSSIARCHEEYEDAFSRNVSLPRLNKLPANWPATPPPWLLGRLGTGSRGSQNILGQRWSPAKWPQWMNEVKEGPNKQGGLTVRRHSVSQLVAVVQLRSKSPYSWKDSYKAIGGRSPRLSLLNINSDGS